MHRRLALLVCLAIVPSAAVGAELPAVLAAVPGDAAGFVAIDVRGILDSPLCDDVRFALGAVTPAELAAFAKKSPLDPAIIDRAVIVFPNQATLMEPVPSAFPTAVSALAIIGCSKPFDPTVLNASFYTAGRPKSYRGRLYQFDEDTWSGLLVLPGNRAFVVGAEDSLVWLIDRLEQGLDSGPLAPARAEAVGHAIFVAVNPAAAAQQAPGIPPPLQPLVEAQRICLSIDIGNRIRGRLEAHYADESGAERGDQAIKALIEMGRGGLKQAERFLLLAMDEAAPNGRTDVSVLPQRTAALVGLGVVRRVDEALAKSPPERKETVIRYAVELPFANVSPMMISGVAAITALGRSANATFQSVGSSIGGPGGPAPQEARLKKLAAAFDAYYAEHGHYPPAMTVAKDGSPLLSWRVALLPYLGEKKLFEEFRQNEPWDSLHNKKLIARMPIVFNKQLSFPDKNGRTNTMVATGPGALFDGAEGKKRPAGGVPILALEPDSVKYAWWTKPSDLPFARGKPPAVFHNYEFSACWAVFTDGTTKQLRKKEDEKRLPELISPSQDRD
jgi:Protein of unknown function (DUF1559)